MMGERKAGIRQNTERVVGFFLSLCLIGFLATGCIAIPTPAKHIVRAPAKHIFQDQTIADTSFNLTPGKTTRNEILTSYGPPIAIWEEEHALIYCWDESKWAWLVLGYDSGGYERNWKKKIGLLRFNDQGVLMDMKIEDRPKLRRTGQFLMDWVYGNGTQESKLLIEKQQMVPVLMRIVRRSNGKRRISSVGTWREVTIKLGGFWTGGIIGDKKPNRIPREFRIPEKFKQGGWILYYVEPGNLYSSFEYLGHEGKEFFIIQVDVPISETPIYVGSFYFDRDLLKQGSNLRDPIFTHHRFGGVLDESDLAQQVAVEVFPENSTLETSLAVTHEGPLILTSPSYLNQPDTDYE